MISTPKLPVNEISRSTVARMMVRGKKRCVVIEHDRFLLIGDEDDVVVVSIATRNGREYISTTPNKLHQF